MTQTDHSEDITDLTGEIARLQRSFRIACANLVALNDANRALREAIDVATILLDQLMTEMRMADVTPSPGVVVTKATLDQNMRKLFALGAPAAPQNNDIDPRDPDDVTK